VISIEKSKECILNRPLVDGLIDYSCSLNDPKLERHPSFEFTGTF